MDAKKEDGSMADVESFESIALLVPTRRASPRNDMRKGSGKTVTGEGARARTDSLYGYC